MFFVFLKDNLLHCLKMLNNVTLSRNNFEHFPTGPPKQFASVQVQDYIVVVIYEEVSIRLSMMTATKHSVIVSRTAKVQACKL